MRNAYYQWKQGIFALLAESSLDYKKSDLWKNYYRAGYDPEEAVDKFVLDDFIRRQEPLGYEFEKILFDNIHKLYID